MHYLTFTSNTSSLHIVYTMHKPGHLNCLAKKIGLKDHLRSLILTDKSSVLKYVQLCHCWGSYLQVMIILPYFQLIFILPHVLRPPPPSSTLLRPFFFPSSPLFLFCRYSNFCTGCLPISYTILVIIMLMSELPNMKYGCYKLSWKLPMSSRTTIVF